MKCHSVIIAALAVLCLTFGCSVPQKRQPLAAGQPSAAGDSTLYGLVCDGSNDSIVVFLNDPSDGSDPDTLDILDASSRRQVFGTLRIGDKVALKRNAADSTKADIVIVTQDLIGQWCYKVKPTLRRRAGMQPVEELPDSVRKMLDEEREYGFTLKIDSLAMPVGMRQRAAADEESPVEYPRMKRYRQWYISNGRLLLTQARVDSVGNPLPAVVDTAALVLLTPDSLILRFADGDHSYYRKTDGE